MTRRLERSNDVSRSNSLWQTLFNLQATCSHYSEASKRIQSSEDLKSAVAFGLKN